MKVAGAIVIAVALIAVVYFYRVQNEKKWESAAPAERGLMLVEDNGCRACHLVGNSFRAPELEKLYGRQVALNDGSVAIVDAEYIRQSILEPSSKVSAGYQAVMPSYRGMLTDQEIDLIIEYTKL